MTLEKNFSPQRRQGRKEENGLIPKIGKPILGIRILGVLGVFAARKIFLSAPISPLEALEL
jgi:hypothetical protein